MTTHTLPPAELHAELQARLVAARATRKKGKPSHPRGRIRAKTAVVGAMAVLLIGAMSVFADGGNLNVEVPNNTEYQADITDDGAIVEYIGSDHTDFGSSGSGVFEAFLRTHASPSETGYNTDFSPFEFDEVGGAFTHSILVSEIPVVECEAVDPAFSDPAETGLCWELFADINDSNSTPLIQLTDLELYLTDDPAITGYPFAASATKVYDFLGQIKINDVNPGSGRGDLRYSVPLSSIDLSTLAPDCEYGSSTCETYFVVFTGWGDPADGDYSSDAGFNEWKVKRYPFLDVTKTATTTFTRTFNWTIDKSVDPDSWNLFDGDSGTSDYTIAVTKDEGTDTDHAVSGTITIENPSDQDAIIESVTDEISGVGAATVDCGVEFPYELDEGDSLICTYSRSLPDGADRTNTATATLDTSQVFMGDAPVTFGDPTTVVDGTIHVVDNNLALPGEPVAFSDDGSVDVSKTFDCTGVEYTDGHGSYTFDNTATIQETDQSDSASVAVDCYQLDVTKDADESRTRTWNWTIDKVVDPDSWSLFDGDTGTSDYTVTVDKVDFTDSDFHVEGSITIDNPNPSRSATLTGVTDSISGFGAATVDCPALTVPAGGSLVCTYEADLPDGTTRTNTATATQQNYDFASDGTPTDDGTTDYSGMATVDFTGATTNEVNATINVTDTFAGALGSFSDDGTAEYSRLFDCEGVEYTDGHGSYTADNTATIDETGQNDSASVDVDCYQLDVTKTADETFDRTYTWTIDKSADQTELTLMPGETFPVNYTVDVDVDTIVDSNFDVTGDIVIDNPNPDRDADLTGVVDVIAVGINATVDCPSLTVLAGDSLTCTYEAQDLPDGTTRLNTATATQQNYDFDSDEIGTPSGTTEYSGTENVDFSGATINEIDECVDVFDTHAVSIANPTGFLGTVCEDSAPAQFTYQINIGPYTTEDCGETTVDDTATFVTSDTATEGSDSWTVIVTIPCPEGCTLTLGYWKTHNETFPGGAPVDPNWFLIGDIDGDGFSEGELEDFFDTGMTWYDVFWTNVAGRPYYQLAHQWMAAYINTLNIQAIGGSIPADVQDALDDGAALLDEWDGSEAGKTPDLKGKGAKDIRAEFTSLAGILGAFNEGDIGPGHCDEPPPPVELTGGLVLAFPILFVAPAVEWARRRIRR
jgi:hypothetical protein